MLYGASLQITESFAFVGIMFVQSLLFNFFNVPYIFVFNHFFSGQVILQKCIHMVVTFHCLKSFNFHSFLHKDNLPSVAIKAFIIWLLLFGLIPIIFSLLHCATFLSRFLFFTPPGVLFTSCRPLCLPYLPFTWCFYSSFSSQLRHHILHKVFPTSSVCVRRPCNALCLLCHSSYMDIASHITVLTYLFSVHS